MGAPVDRKNPLLFLSSVLRGGVAVPDGLRKERENIYRYGEHFGHNSVWVDEQIRLTTSTDPFEDIDDFLFELQRSKVYLVMVASDWPGSGIKVDGSVANTTFFETELFYAATLGRPIIVILRTDIVIPPDTQAVLELLQRAVPSIAWYPVNSSAAAEEQAKRVIAQIADDSLPENRIVRPDFGRILFEWWRWREPSTDSPGVRWLDGRFLTTRDTPNAQIITGCLQRTSDKISEGQRLSRLWIAARELMGVPYTRSVDEHWLELWNRVLTEWNSAAAWYGLHGHLELGYMGALWSLDDLRKSVRARNPHLHDDPQWDRPFSSLASAYYATASRVRSWRFRNRGYRKAMVLLDSQVSRDEISYSNLLAIRGSIQQKQMAFGASVETYRQVLKIRESHPNASTGSVGEAMTELGFGMQFILKFRDGRQLIRDGLALMEQSGYRLGFIVRGKRKLAVAQLLSGDFRGARATRLEADDLEIASRIGDADVK